ncbi:Sensor protein ZraS [Marine Group I thaumarchaeote SCGC AAA799-B03]|uniref:Sensor protein ZraS n=3 Tax=Marine Group I TaxID=905826 RepID=A0A087S6B5_9ARCH|nr:Sensor protein ZraS [Marine Group I thaumarchaeote SCGC AAA799-D11]KFM18001.1 Sensor histidine kinase ResE protein [Marine Group I thaumarchaeote SCGC RSA3]KFM21269.1 Sensor protein ZraS [Marine Group I thaumarchaeote SCGC AAA799-B03]
MRIKRKLFSQFIAIFCITFFVLFTWYGVLLPELNKLDENYNLVVEYSAQTTHVDDVYGELKGPYYQTNILSEEVIKKDGDILTIKSSVVGKKIRTGEIMFQVENIYNVDSKTLLHVDKPGKRWGFLPGVEKKDYDFFHPAVFYDDPMIFKKTEMVHGIETYVFETVTKGADTSKAFPQFAPHVIHTDTTSWLWIEPITGQLVKFEKIWDNYLVEDGQRVNTIQIGGKNTTDFTELILVDFAKNKIETIQFQNYVLPIFILIAIFSFGIIWVLWTHLKKLQKESEKQEKMVLIGNTTASISHNLRNPLSVIKLSLDMLDKSELSSQKRKEYLDRAKNGVDRMSYHINTMLNFVRDYPLEIQKTGLKKIFQATFDEITVPKEIDLETTIPDIMLYVDEKQIQTVFSNIILNAIDATKKGKISIIAKETEDGIQIEFIDSGPGISKDKINNIFEPLYTTKQSGTGLGLSSAKRIIESHGGIIEVQNNPTKFTITLPKNNS